jgi:hypothetical protein
MPMTAYLRKKLGDHAIGKASFTMPTTAYLALFTANPGDSGSLTNEVTGTGYARIAITSKMDAFDAVTGIAVSNDEINFGVPGSNWSGGLPISYVGIMDASGAGTGNMLYYEQIPNPRAAPSGSRPVKFAAGQVQIRHI